jgi:hypothetical protein
VVISAWYRDGCYISDEAKSSRKTNMATNIFSTYSTGENRVTASILAVLQSLSLGRIERLIGALLEQPEFELVRFQNQPAKGGTSVPDAEIVSNCRILVETKIKQGAVNVTQLTQHLDQLKNVSEERRVLLVITPDAQRPQEFAQFENLVESPNVTWASFAALDQAIDELMSDPREVISEREAFLLRELQEMLVREKLLEIDKDVVVVAARTAWSEYLRYHAYVCQPDRTFRPVKRMAFYTGGQIFPRVPKIEAVHERVEFIAGLPGPLGTLVDQLLAETSRKAGMSYKVMFLSPPEATDTAKLPQAIVNDLTSDSGQTIAFTQGQRYVTLEQLRKVRTTSELIAP